MELDPFLIPRRRFTRLYDPLHVREGHFWDAETDFASGTPSRSRRKILFELFRLELLSALLFNEQILIPQTQLLIGPVPKLFGELQQAVISYTHSRPGFRLPIVLQRPFLPSLSKQLGFKHSAGLESFSNRFSPLIFALGQIPEGTADKPEHFGHIEFDYDASGKLNEGLARARRSALRSLYGELTREGCTGSITDSTERALTEAFPSVSAGFIGLAKSYCLGLPAWQTNEVGTDFGATVRELFSDPTTREVVAESVPDWLRSAVGSFMEKIKSDRRITGRADFQRIEDYRTGSFKDCFDALGEIWSFAIHVELSLRMAASQNTYEELPGSRIVPRILRESPELIKSLRNEDRTGNSAFGTLFTSIGREAVDRLGLEDAAWNGLWRIIVQYMCETEWADLIKKFRSCRLQYWEHRDKQSKRELSKAAAALFDNFMDNLGKAVDKNDIPFEFDLVEHTDFARLARLTGKIAQLGGHVADTISFIVSSVKYTELLLPQPPSGLLFDPNSLNDIRVGAGTAKSASGMLQGAARIGGEDVPLLRRHVLEKQLREL